jgi:hypothetical protein
MLMTSYSAFIRSPESSNAWETKDGDGENGEINYDFKEFNNEQKQK